MSEMPVVTDVQTGSAGLSGPANAKTPEHLRALAAQFESLLLGQMLKEMRQSMFDDEDGEKSTGLGAGPLADALFSEISVALSRAGGMGLGASLAGPLIEQAGLMGSGQGTAGLMMPGGLSLPSLDAPSPADTMSPMPGRLSSGYGWRRDPFNGSLKFHNGLDLALPVGSEVPVAKPGEVAFAGELAGYGLTVVVKHDDRTSTRYAHLSEILVTPGDAVGAGETIARSGATGRTTGPHLHFEVLEGGQPVDPAGR